MSTGVPSQAYEMQSHLTKIFLASTLVLSTFTTTLTMPSYAADGDAPALRGSISMDDLSMQVVRKEVELAAFNAEFRNHYMQPNKWRKRRIKFYEMTAGGIANAGDITLISQFWHYYRNVGAGLKHKGSLESGAITVMVAYLTLGGLYAAEGVNDLFHDYKAMKHGWDAKSVLKRAETLKGEIDAAIAARKSTIDSDTSLSSSERQVLDMESKVLSESRDLGLLEFNKTVCRCTKKAYCS